MKTKDLARTLGVDVATLDAWVKKSNYEYKSGRMGGLEIESQHDVDKITELFRRYAAEEQARQAEQRAASEKQEQIKQQAMASMLITSGFSFDGYTITKYSGYISGDDVVQVARGREGIFSGGATNVGASLMQSLTQIRRNALVELKEAAYALGCNAVIGVDFDYLTLDPETVNANGGTLYLPYVFGVTANGNAVVIERG